MDWSRKHIGAVVLPPKGQLLYKQNLINPDLDHDTIAILQRNHNVLPFAILDSQSSIHSTQNQTQNAIKDNSAIQIQFLLWDFTGDFLLSLNNHNTILIWTMGETIQDWNIIQTIQLSDSPLSVSFYQQRPKYDVTYDLTDNIPILNYSTIGPSFLFGQLAINIVLSTGLFQTWYYNGEQVLSHLDYMLDDLLQDTLTHVDTFVHKRIEILLIFTDRKHCTNWCL
ncbi:hypothetical protein BC833DRAFT_204533 [Globomyces pollinis-pini]|nr:hypothetical protein BC833DRAFT_204533 [Globomyces pollinis-pini]